jgi:hypothetical protein
VIAVARKPRTNEQKLKQKGLEKMTRKITIAGLKSFIRKNRDDLYVKTLSDFDGMTDCVQPVEMDFVKVNPNCIDFADNTTLGMPCVWLVCAGRNYCYMWDDESGISVHNSCGSWEIKKGK